MQVSRKTILSLTTKLMSEQADRDSNQNGLAQGQRKNGLRIGG
jgi:hypothetical protein